MGGDLFGVDRMSNHTYKKLSVEISNILRPLFNNIAIPIPIGFKKTHGDIDFIVTRPTNPDYINIIKRAFNSDRMEKQGPLTSFTYNNGVEPVVQVDLMLVEPEQFEMQYWFESNGDLNSYIGKIAHSMGFSYGMSGLKLVFYSKNGVIYHNNVNGSQYHELLLSRNPREILKFMGLSPDRYIQGFTTVDQVVQFLKQSPYFIRSVDTGKAHNVRMRKRPCYVAIYKAVQSRTDIAISVDINVEQQRDRALSYFDKRDEYLELVETIRRNYIYKQSVNADLVGEVSGLQRKQLGELMKVVRSLIDYQLLEILSQDQLRQVIKLIHARSRDDCQLPRLFYLRYIQYLLTIVKNKEKVIQKVERQYPNYESLDTDRLCELYNKLLRYV